MHETTPLLQKTSFLDRGQQHVGCTGKNFDRHVDTWWSHTFRQTDSFFCRLRRGGSSLTMPSCGYLHLQRHGHLEARPVRDGVPVRACHARTTSPEGPRWLPRFAHTRHCFLRFGLGCDNGWPVAKATFAREGPGFPGAHFPQLRQDLLRADSTQKLSRCVAFRLHQLSRASSTVRAL